MKRALAAALLAIVTAGCVSFRYDRSTVNVPPRKGAIEALLPGRTTLDEALAALGAPLHAWEYKGDGMALAWGWSKDVTRGVRVSAPVVRGQSVSASYADLATHLRGVVLLFDERLVLEQVKKGALNEIREGLDRRRPAPVEP